jgi:hypothetical protein
MNAAEQSRRLLVGSKLVNQFRRSLQLNIDLTRLLAEENFARELLMTLREGHADEALTAMMDEFEQASIRAGAWHSSPPPKPSKYTPNADGTIPASAAWDPEYVPPPPSSRPTAAPQVDLEPSVSPRVQVLADQKRLSTGFFSRFGLTKPPTQSSTLPSGLQKSSHLPEPDAPSEPVDPKLKKYIRGAR